MKAIQVHDVAKRFKIYYDRNRTLKERLLFRKRNRYDERWVLKDISFDIEQGEAVGLVGENGCGKSTTLKLLSRILFPDRGTISVNGRVSCLIELGAGFHPDMNGIENIYLNAAMFGVGRKETSKRLDRIIAFSELKPFIENPIRTYSSGMYMRLAFSVAINVDADVLLIDEILAVGDMNFQEKCLARLREIKERGATIVIVSHSLGQIEAFCDRSIWIDGGRVRADGAPAETHARYAAFMNGKKSQ
ncbi:ABC transporter ATP-binding protein [Pyramidobacter piscolens]|uniref:ABC transporter ATP-binding protein n=1 Tax=Pyramidobacter piscolens TaxID=638849 RepID=UPI003AB81864